jgi:hypothetical protein
MPDLLLATQIVPSAGNSRAMHLGLHGGTILPHCGPGVAGLPRGTLPLITGPGACHYPWHRLPYVLFSPWSAGDPVAVITLKLARPAAYCDTPLFPGRPRMAGRLPRRRLSPDAVSRPPGGFSNEATAGPAVSRRGHCAPARHSKSGCQNLVWPSSGSPAVDHSLARPHCWHIGSRCEWRGRQSEKRIRPATREGNKHGNRYSQVVQRRKGLRIHRPRRRKR